MPLEPRIAKQEKEIEIRVMVDDGGGHEYIDYEYEPPIDLFVYQEETDFSKIPEDFCKKQK